MPDKITVFIEQKFPSRGHGDKSSSSLSVHCKTYSTVVPSLEFPVRLPTYTPLLMATAFHFGWVHPGQTLSLQ